jgi:hypothetical protein
MGLAMANEETPFGVVLPSLEWLQDIAKVRVNKIIDRQG